jgi:hypothetical protein
LHEFLLENRDDILRRSREKLSGRLVPTPTAAELAHGLPIFLDQLIAILRTDKGHRNAGHRSVSESAGLHGGALLRLGLTIGQVVHDYGSICQSVTEVADERGVAIAAGEFQTLNRCLDDAIAEAVTAYQSQRDRTLGGQGRAPRFSGARNAQLARHLDADVRGTRARQRRRSGEHRRVARAQSSPHAGPHRPYSRGGSPRGGNRQTKDQRVLIDVADECGGLPPGKSEDLFRPLEQRGADQNGLRLGLSISLKGVRASGGELRVTDRPGTGCLFTVDLPQAPPLA